jgi:hypothetical protein
MSSSRDEQFLRHLQQFCQCLLCRRQRAKSGRNCWRTALLVLFLFFVLAPYHALTSQPGDIERPQIAFHQFIANGDKRS